MESRKIVSAVKAGALLLALASFPQLAGAQAHERLRVVAGRAEVVNLSDEVRTVAIAEPKIADAAVGSAKSVVVNGKAPGITSLVVYTEGGRYKVYDVEVYVPNGAKQVLLRCRVAEINDNAKRELGFDWVGDGANSDGAFLGGLFTTKVSTPAIPLGFGPRTDGTFDFVNHNGSFHLQTTWRALEEKGDIRVLATPTLVARSGEKAEFHAGGEFPVPIASGGGSGGLVAVTIEWKEFGVKLDFTPTIGEDNSISLKVAPEVSQIDFTNPLVLSGFTVPTLVTRKASTTVQMMQGEHLVIGGLKQTENTRVVKRIPILGQIPLLGFFFSNTRTEKVDRELMVVVSPEIVEASATTPKLPTDRPESK
ncbi:MAG TPA: pilus assembly protein N-terminal domain-containing protein [Candidatus Limnocylindria bacterium]|nr:pilus assembly protein N-terminal domain-containing protein [Candidatus Limnocylindria bacterium]